MVVLFELVCSSDAILNFAVNMAFERASTPKPGGEKKSCCTKLVIGISLIVVGVIFIVIGLVFGAYLPGAIDDQIKSGVTTCDASEIDDMDKFANPHGDCDTCVPYYYQYSPFSIVNPTEVLKSQGETKLQVQEKGPYVFRKFQTKVDISFENNEISYQTFSRYEYIPESSCKNCKLTDELTTIDTGYLAVMTGAGGEDSFAETLITGLLSKAGADQDSIDRLNANEPFKQVLLMALSGLNSLEPTAMFNSLLALGPVIKMDQNASADDKLEIILTFISKFADFENKLPHYGLFAKRTVQEYAYGYPSLLAGLATTAELGNCMKPENAFCMKCDFNNPSKQCVENWKVCKSCRTALGVKAMSKGLCDALEVDLTKKSEKNMAKLLVDSTCRQCETDAQLFCLARLPGQVMAERADFNQVDALKNKQLLAGRTSQRTGCDNIDQIGFYSSYEGVTENALWENGKPINRNPTAKELAEFNKNNYCGESKLQTTSCVPVFGGDGAAYPPSGASLSGLEDQVTVTEQPTYISQARQNLTLIATDEKPQVEGVVLQRYRPSNDVLKSAGAPDGRGIGSPVDGVLSLGYNVGFLAFLSYPFFIFGDKSLLENVELYFRDGSRASIANMYTGDELNEAFYDKYSTQIDVEPATGKTMDARKRLMASYSVAAVDTETDAAITNLSLLKLTPNVIIPVFWGEERATVTASLAAKLVSVRKLGSSMLPVLIVALILGIIILAVGIFFVIKHKRQVRASFSS